VEGYFLLYKSSRPRARIVTGTGAGVDSVWEQRKLEARKMLENATESPASSAPKMMKAIILDKRNRRAAHGLDKSIHINGKHASRTKQWRRASSQSRGAPWFPVKLIYTPRTVHPGQAGGECCRVHASTEKTPMRKLNF